MREAAGQVARQAHQAAHLLLGLCMLVLLGLAALGLRLAQGPIPMDFLAQAIEARANRLDSEMRIEIGQASIGWDGWHSTGMTPLQLRLGGVRLRDRDGSVRAELPDASASLAIPWLLRGELAPGRLELRRPMLRLRRAEDGSVSVMVGPADPDIAATTAPEVPPGTASLEDLLAELMRPPAADTPLGALSLLQLTDAMVMVEDAALGMAWSLDEATIELRRRPQGGIVARGAAVLRLGEARLPLRGSGEAEGSPPTITFRLAADDIRPARLAEAAGSLVPAGLARHLDAVEASVGAALSGRLDLAGGIHAMRLALESGAGRVGLGDLGSVAFAAAELVIERDAADIRVPQARLLLAGAEAPTITASALLQRAEAGWAATAELGLDAAPAAGLAGWWPERLLPQTRAWLVENITAGRARNGRWRIAARAGPEFTDPALTEVAGTLDVSDATVHWLRPIPPAEGAAGRIVFGLDAIAVQIAAARQAGGGLQTRDATARILFLPDDREELEIALPVSGPAGDALALLKHPRLKLFERRPLPIQDARGTLEGRLTIGLPLLQDLPVERLRFAGEGRLRDLRLPDIALGRPLERGQIEFTVNTDGLRASGTGTLATVQGRLAVEADFRRGAATQPVLRASLVGRATGAQLAALDLGREEVLRGPVGLDLRYELRRNGTARLTARADLREATLALEPLRWGKPPGQNGGADLVLRLNGDAAEAIESFRIEAPSLLVRGDAAFARGARLERVNIAEARVDASRFSGEARPPSRDAAAWQLSLRGAVLDVQRRMAEPAPAEEPGATPETGPAFAVQARFDRVLLGPQRELAALDARVQVDGSGVIRSGRLAGRTGPRGPFEATITPTGEGRALRLTAQEAGALLAAFDVLRHLEGGRLSVNATYAHNGPGAPLSGTAEMDDFVVHNAPAFGKLLQAMTLFGLFEALSGPGLNFARLVAPFTLHGDTLTLSDARAFSASLGLTARGTLDRRRQRIAVDGTIVPAYMFNSLLGNIPVLGRIFSPEAGGGVFAATFRLSGPVADPQVSVNPLAALTPGFLRGLFGIGQAPAQP